MILPLKWATFSNVLMRISYQITTEMDMNNYQINKISKSLDLISTHINRVEISVIYLRKSPLVLGIFFFFFFTYIANSRST